MGSGYYHNDVREALRDIGTTRHVTADAFDYDRRASIGEVTEVHRDLNILGKLRECVNSAQHPEATPIVVAMDVTSSRGDDTKKIYEQVPALLGSLKLSGVVPDPQIMWAAVGDANSDRAPIQVSQFESDRRIDADLKKIWMEKGGGGTGEESYELLAWYLAHRTKLDIAARKKKGYLFFTGDEAPYSVVSKQFVERYVGVSLRSDVSSKETFQEVQKKFHTFLVFPRSTAEDRHAAIDTEVRRRLELAGGRFENVDIRATLLWNDRNDLDLHCLTPQGSHIYFASKRARCGGELDVDRNVHGETTKPVENIRWAKGDAKSGTYKFWVELYRHHESRHKEIPFKVELDVGGKVSTVSGVIPADALHDEGRCVVAEFHYTPQKLRRKGDEYEAYGDEVVLAKWAAYIPSHHILRVQDPASSVEVIIGAIALQEGTTIDEVEASMRKRRVEKARREDVLAALMDFATQGVFPKVSAELFG